MLNIHRVLLPLLNITYITAVVELYIRQAAKHQTWGQQKYIKSDRQPNITLESRASWTSKSVNNV